MVQYTVIACNTSNYTSNSSLLFHAYQATGMASWPIGMMKGRRSLTKEVSEVHQERATVASIRNSVSLNCFVDMLSILLLPYQ